ncbi:MAG: hypothetical protein N838_12625 [Thiohalocapsa sp. PB-PSB1]|jgi:hypothetical protein|nr:MAG: hypothetical protein N838_12625 [Thiohalocapsa sp. PB-PSB1]
MNLHGVSVSDRIMQNLILVLILVLRERPERAFLGYGNGHPFRGTRILWIWRGKRALPPSTRNLAVTATQAVRAIGYRLCYRTPRASESVRDGWNTQ